MSLGFSCLLGVTGCGSDDSSSGTGGSGGTGGDMGMGGSGGGTGGGTGGGAAPDFPSTGDSHKYVVSKMRLPARTAEARMLGCDLNNEGEEDNQLGNILAAVGGQGVDAQAGIDGSIDEGSITMLAEVVASDIVNAGAGEAGIRAYIGTHAYNPFDPAVAYGGMGEFNMGTLAGQLGGTITNGVGDFGPENLNIQFVLVEGQAPLNVSLIAGRIADVTVSANGLMGGKICGAITEEDLDGEVIPTVASLLAGRIADGGETARTLCNIFDTDMSCAADAAECANFDGAANVPPDGCITATEVKENPIVRSVLKPDVEIGGVKALSLGIGFDAVSASF